MADSRNCRLSRRSFLKKMRWAPTLFLPAPFYGAPLHLQVSTVVRDANREASSALTDAHLIPHYPSTSPLEDVLRLAIPGTDEYVSEKYAFEIGHRLEEWSRGLRANPPAVEVLARFVSPSVEASSLVSVGGVTVRSGYGIDVLRRQLSQNLLPGKDRFLEAMSGYLATLSHIETAEFHLVGIEVGAQSPPSVHAEIRYDLVGIQGDGTREERIGRWRTLWSSNANTWWIVGWEAGEETVSCARVPVFIDVTAQALGPVDSYRNQMLRGADYWRTVLDGACGINLYGNNGLAVGDFNNDGLDDLYVCQPPGLPNRLYRNRGDGTFEDVTESCGVGVIDGTACALFADFENKGLRDLLVVSAGGPLLFLNQGNGKFSLKPDAFKFAQPPQGTFTHAALADYDNDGRLDIYFCLYSYYLGLDQYRYPAPYFDARNGPPNFLFHNEGNGAFVDRTEAAGLNVDNDRYSFACAWGDANANGRPDLYVANDFGRNNLYRNNGDGTFVCVSADAHVDDVGAGMSATWLDYDNDGKQDIYVSNMWSAAGLRASEQKIFHEKDPDTIRALYRQHARGNSLYRNLGNGRFQNVSAEAGVEMGRWAWSSDGWDFDHDGYPDLYIANGYVSGPDRLDLGSFFWRQVIGKSPATAKPSPNYERGWNAINELIRSDISWNGYERNVVYLNNHDGTFSEVSGAVGLDFLDDSRAFALADLDHDGRLEIVLKNRNAPQLRVLRNAMKDMGDCIAVRLRGQKSNRDAIGASVTVEAGGHRQTKYLQAGTGFLSQHTTELFFGLGRTQDPVRATVRWPSGLAQTFEQLPVNHRIKIEEGSTDFVASPFASPPASYARAGEAAQVKPPPTIFATWLIDPLAAPDFSLPDFAGNEHTLRSFRGGLVLIQFWTLGSERSKHQLRVLQSSRSDFAALGLRVVCVNADDPMDPAAVRSFVAEEKISLVTLLATREVAGVYNIIYRYLFDRRRDLPIPTAFLLDEKGLIIRIYQGPLRPEELVEDVRTIPRTAVDRLRKALPAGGLLPDAGFRRNEFTYGVALFQRGYLDQAAESFQQVINAKPQEPEAFYNLGTLYLRRNNFPEARRYLEQTVQLRSNYPEAWNNLGMIAAQEGHADDAVRNFQQALQQRPDYATALLNLGGLYRRQGNFAEAEKLLRRALELEPDNPEVNYAMGMLYARQEQLPSALQYLQRAVALRPDYPDALNNLGVLFVRQQRYAEAEEQLKTCIRVAPNFDQGYLNLARLYADMQDTQKARETLQALLKVQPDHKMAQQALEMLH